MTREQRLTELARLVGIWRSARCGFRGARGHLYPDSDPHCDGDNHVESCPVQRALDDVIAAHNALGAPGMR